MSSNRRPRTLRAKLVAGQALLLAVLVAIVGLVALLVLREYLMDDLDRQVRAVSRGPGGFALDVDRPPPGRAPSWPSAISCWTRTATRCAGAETSSS